MEIHGFLNVDKPLGLTSHDVVGRLRRILGTRRVGHAGTLDPAATGVLVAGVGRATRFLDYVQHETKSYVAHIVLGCESETADVDGNVLDDRVPNPAPVDESAVRQLLPDFVGVIDQIPPRYSSIKQGGEPVHRKMRRGEHVEVPVRQVRVDSLEISYFSYPDLLLSITCGPGVYVRSLARDIGERIGSGAYLHHLVRTSVGCFLIEEAVSLQRLERLEFPECWTLASTAIDHGIALSPAMFLGQSDQNAWYHGRSMRSVSSGTSVDSLVRAFDQDGQFAGIGIVAESDDQACTVRPRIVLSTN